MIIFRDCERLKAENKTLKEKNAELRRLIERAWMVLSPPLGKQTQLVDDLAAQL